ncbi:glycosyltransferase family 2 protein [Cryobacterium sp. TMT1-62]|uniref:Glycosyltransferase family 2 protein n=1 Tax=Cryobacterium sandaracinum TaxID=1259247 RepID=A0ABY2JIR7_9MICO|nr:MULTISPECIES: glycosyltransferase [Cryobacterium]TFB57359.1 glycosyltransferase family 2 protein [Cryobacterium sp. Sr3]TFB64600.1 glycosyltransferase family 2 protein [Cryobacterium sp. Hz7]TFC35012.1 glycosyltransferase family 2 protein [Cryobacterium sp. TMT2-14]TFC51397.1 glycosyltransferase family 2 protein [Cryobacterium sp. TMT2-17-1]TFC71588.1 glycosyltransferase family 2 protein [Cryobacterium sp. TMT2-4]
MSGPSASPVGPALPTVGVVLLTQGTRPDDLARGIRSLLAQQGVLLDIVCVGNGWQPTGLPDQVKTLGLPENLGIPAGRNRGVSRVAGEFLFFLDDDASIPDPHFLRDAIGVLRADSTIGLLQPRVVDPAGIVSPRRWIPRIRKGEATHSSNVFSVWEGAVLLPRAAFDATGGWAEPFFYAHEGIELAWRVWDLGLRAWYAGELEANHPVIAPTRHADYYRLNARNRVWLARRNLPVLLVPVYAGSWLLIQVLRWARNPGALRAWLTGFREGWTTDPGERRPLRARTVWRMTLAGRPPIV